MTTMTVNFLAEPLWLKDARPTVKPVASRLELSLDAQDGVPMARLVGELDGDGAAAIERLADDLAAQGEPRVVLDLRRLFAADFAGLAALRDAAALLSECGGQLALAGLRPRVRYFLARTGTADQFATYQTIEDAVAAVAVGGVPARSVAELRQPVSPTARPMVPALVSAMTHR
jgi:anti-anti-sigma factor